MDVKHIVETLPHSVSVPNIDSNITIDDARSYIYSIDFENIVNKITQKDLLVSRVWSREEAEEDVSYYKNFLYLNKKYLSIHPVIPPSTEIDEIWHHHILDTRKYHNDCSNIFGYYFHHYPYFGMRSESDFNNLNDAFKVTQDLHYKEFGDYIYKII